MKSKLCPTVASVAGVPAICGAAFVGCDGSFAPSLESSGSLVEEDPLGVLGGVAGSVGLTAGGR
jgi:hypothetical protein